MPQKKKNRKRSGQYMPVILATQKVTAEVSQVQGQPGQPSETYSQKKKEKRTRPWWLTPIILATWEVEIGRSL
jgi:hypothetical protein